MRNRTLIAILTAAGLCALLATASITSGALGGVAEGGRTMHVTVTTNDELGVVAGLVTESLQGPLGLDLGSETTPEQGWIVLAPEDAPAIEDATLTVTDETPFTDPNGGTWLSREVTYEGTTAWAVPIGQAREDPTLESTYNFALVVDWGQVPDDADLTASYHETLELTEPDAR